MVIIVPVYEKEQAGVLYNTAAVIDADGTYLGKYRKNHIPHTSGFWEKFFFKPGNLGYPVFQTKYAKVGVYICYEAIYPDEVREFAAQGANLLINISNDGWFGKSAAADQHLRMARVRAVENRRWVLRVTNSGLTAAIDPYGRAYQTIPRDVRGAVDLPYDFRTDTTLYTRFGDWFAWMCVLVSVILLANTFWKKPCCSPSVRILSRT